MGKKKVIQQTGEEILKETEAMESAASKASAGTTKKVERGKVYIRSSYNNMIITVTDVKGSVLAWATSGSLGFSGPKKATPFAASKVVAALAEKLRRNGPLHVDVVVRGVGGGRDAALRSLINQGFDVLSIKDVTPVPHNGPRRPKVRRV